MTNLKIYCVTDKQIKELEDLKLDLVGVGNETFSENVQKLSSFRSTSC